MAEPILVVDDDPDIARFVEVNLRSAGYDVAVAGDGEEALEKAGDMRPDLVLLDVMMPRIDGFEVAQRLRKNPQTANTLDHHAHREGAVRRQGDRPPVGRRRLHHQAVRPDRAPRPREGHPPTRQGDAEPLAAHGTARQHPDPGGDRATGPRWTPVRGPVLRPGQLQGVQRPEGVRARRPADPGDGAGSSRTPSSMHDGSDGFVGHVGGDDFVAVVDPESAEDVAKRDLRALRCQVRSEFYEPEDLATRLRPRWRTARVCCRTSRSSGISVGIASTLAPGRSRTTARRSPWPPR